MVVKILNDCGIIRDDATQVGKVVHCAEVGTIDADMRLYTSRGGGQHLSLLKADGEGEVLGCIRETVDDVLYSFFREGEKAAVVSKQQISDEFFNGFRVCNETPKVVHAAVCSETDVDVVWQVLFCLTKHDAEEDGEQCGGQYAPLLDAVGDEKAARQ